MNNVDVSQALYAVESAIAGRLMRQDLPPPRTLDREDWPPDYARVMAWRQQQLARFEEDPDLLESARDWYAGRDLIRDRIIDPAAYAERTIAWVCHWVDTSDPRLIGKGGSSRIPMVLFRRQAEMVHFIYACMMGDAQGLVEKSRDMGATWVASGVSVKEWVYQPGFVAGWGSNKSEQVDVLGNPKSIFEKLRMLIRALPDCFRPSVQEGIDLKQHTCRNPDNGSVIDGEIGKNIGRGGRSRVYFVDEAQPFDARILTPRGFAFMADMQVGSQVVGRDGKPRRVTQVKDCGVHDVYRVVLSDGTWTECSPNHLWEVEEGIIRGKRQKRVLRASKLAGGLKNKHGQHKYRLPSRPVVQFAKRQDSLPLDPYIVGALLGNGTLAKDGGARLTTPDLEIVDEFRKLMPAQCLLNQATAIEFRFVGAAGRLGRAAGGEYVHSVAKTVVVASGIAGCRSWEKFIPGAYLLAAPEERLALLQGLMDTDGYGKGTSYHTCSPRLADDVRFLVQSLGGSATLRVAENRDGFRTMYALTIKLDGMELFRTARKRGSRPARQTDVGRTIFSVTPVGRKPVRCISINDPSGLYLTDHCIVTHNSAHLEHPEGVEASLSENTRCRIDISSVSLPGTVFYRKRQAGREWSPGDKVVKDRANVFVMDWSDHPEKTKEWYSSRRAYFEAQGTPSVVAREIDRDYMGAAEGIIIPYSHVEAAVDAHRRLGFEDDGGWWGGLDVADEGVDTNALVRGRGSVVKYAEEWGERDPGATARKAFRLCRATSPITLQYDCIGLGTNVKSEFNRITVDDALGDAVKWLTLVPWNAGAAVHDPGEPVIKRDKDSPTNKNYFENFKAQAWWNVARMFYRTWRMIQALEGKLDDGEEADFPPDQLISLDSKSIPQAALSKLMRELSQAVMTQSSRLKLMVDKAPEGAKSPNLGDGLIMGRFPARSPSRGRIGMFGPRVFHG